MLMQLPAVTSETEASPRKDLKTLIEDYERTLILEALQATNGNQRQAAFALGILPTTLHEKLKRLGLWRIESLRRIDGSRAGIESTQI
jgi:DNA-binding NtrC family response regulator